LGEDEEKEKHDQERLQLTWEEAEAAVLDRHERCLSTKKLGLV